MSSYRERLAVNDAELAERFERESARFYRLSEAEAQRSSAEDFVVLHGSRPVLFTAPHAVGQTRDGHLKSAEPGTGALAVLLHENQHCSALCKVRNNGDDANYDQVSPFRSAAHQLVAEHGIRLLADLHQLRPDREYGVIVGTGEGRNIFGRNDLTACLVEAFARWGVSGVVIDQKFRACTPNTVAASTARACGIPCFQIEINSRYLLPDYDEYRPTAVYRALADVAAAACDDSDVTKKR